MFYVFFFSVGDPRVNQHIGISLYHTMFTRFHNVLADLFQLLNPEWLDEKLYQEVRRYIVAINQIIFYRDVLHHLLGIHYSAFIIILIFLTGLWKLIFNDNCVKNIIGLWFAKFLDCSNYRSSNLNISQFTLTSFRIKTVLYFQYLN